ncbi:putative sad1-interacting factor 3 protein [Diplogelasinospora grovesii]|uniref:Sad1-interacting factor 3 protein n=1 Tax=Diplogelasinospora grovesii TaxID=303347 RepID=A0AAN6RYV9_9PEZI|nr:putative sad1-interacting factor 3 protein [Diplogelasinospora grovesii]
MASSKRGPSVLVTDARERPQTSRGAPPRPGTANSPGRMPNMRFVSVDNVLQHASEIPSGQPRVPPGLGQGRPTRAAVRRASQGGGLPILASAKTGQQNVPSRTTKVSEKLVLLPETVGDEKGDDDIPSDDESARQAALQRSAEDDERGPLKDEELDVLKKRGGIRGKSYAERLPKVQRGEKVSRLTAYCTAQAFKMKATAEFLRTKHEAKTKLYDDCLYTVYHLPLLPGIEGYRLRSRPILKTPGTGKTVLDLEIERSERRDEHEGYFDEYAYGVRDSPGNGNLMSLAASPETRAEEERNRESERERHRSERSSGDSSNVSESTAVLSSPINRLVPDAKNFGEMFVFSYGVVVFWNFTEHQEKDILADLTFAENETGVSLATRPLDQSDFETEEFHFEYSPDVKRPRVFNDMITLLPRSDHMVKLTISHAIAQSTKLCFFEARMSETMLDAQHVPKRLALTGELNMTRTEIVKMLGRLFKSRVDINLSSNILDVPNFFWDSEPTLHPLYVAIRDYLEIDPRIKVLNERCRVFLDLAEILSDSVADAKMSSITWIIIILIVVSILITVTEVTLRFAILEKEKGKGSDGSSGNKASVNFSRVDLRSLEEVVGGQVTLDDLRMWSAQLGERERAAVCGSEIVGTTFAGV